MTRREKQLYRMRHERILLRLSRTYERQFRRALNGAYRDASKAYKKGQPVEPVVMQKQERLEKIMKNLYLRAYDSVESVIEDQIDEKGHFKLERKRANPFERTAIVFARIWAGERAKRITATTREDINETIVNALEEGYDIVTTSELLLKRGIAQSVTRARAIARTEIHTAQMTGSLDMAKERGVAKRKEWISVDDERVRGLENEDFDHTNIATVDIDEKFDVSGEFLEYPGDPAGSAGNIINCRCVMAYRR